METRIKDKHIDINIDSTIEFWQSRVENGINLKTVLLNVDTSDNMIKTRNLKECNILKSHLIQNKKYNILDIGCGIGRWAGNLFEHINTYNGIDYTKGFIDLASDTYKQDNIKFFQMSATNIDKSLLLDAYDLSIITGVCMYINDENLPQLFTTINNLTTETIYMQESVSLTNGRLTLDKFYSEDLKQTYSAIYRTKTEYEKLLSECCSGFEIISSGLLLDDETGKRNETNAAYWILKRRTYDRK